MIVRAIRLRDFRRFASFEAVFAPGFNVVLGDNEEGKSTLREAITLALFQDPKTSDRNVLAQRRWGAEQQFAVEVEFEADQARYLLVKDFQTKTAQLQTVDGEGRLQDGKAIEARIKQLLGLGSRAVFESTVRVTQRDVTRIRNGQEIADGLQRLLTGGEQDAQATKVIEELDKALAGLKAGGRLNPGPLFALPSSIEERNRTIEEKRSSLGRVEVAKEALMAKTALLVAERETLGLKEQLLRDCADRRRLEEELTKVRAEEASLEQKVASVGAAQAAIAQAEVKLAECAPTSSIAPYAWSDMAVLERRTAGMPAVPAATSTARGGRHVGAGLAGIVLLVAAFLSRDWMLLAAPLLVIGIGAIVWSIAGMSRRRAHALANEIRVSEQRADVAAAAQLLNAMVNAAGCATVAEVRERQRQGDEAQRALLQNRSLLEGLLGGEAVSSVEERRKASSRQRRDCEERLAEPAMRLAALDGLAFQRLGREVDEQRTKIGLLETECAELRVAVHANTVSTDAIHALEEERQELSDRLSAAQTRQRVLTVACDAIEEARVVTMGAAKDTLAAALGARVAEITAGRYSQVAVDGGLNMQVMSPERGELVPVNLDGDLSTGTVEQIYLAARLSIAQLLAGGRKPPLLLDDPFVTFDARRTAAVLRLCRELSQEHQVLLFTCREGYEERGDHVIRLPALSLGQ